MGGGFSYLLSSIHTFNKTLYDNLYKYMLHISVDSSPFIDVNFPPTTTATYDQGVHYYGNWTGNRTSMGDSVGNYSIKRSDRDEEGEMNSWAMGITAAVCCVMLGTALVGYKVYKKRFSERNPSPHIEDAHVTLATEEELSPLVQPAEGRS